jgi:hypothetical protein
MPGFDIRAAFEYARESIIAEQAASRYGIQINRGHRARCPFHGGEHFNLSFKGGGFNCFVCGIHGDSVEFVRLLFQYAKPFEALKRLNTDFGLGLDFENGKPVTANRSIQKQISRIEINVAERELIEATRRRLWEYELSLNWAKRNLTPKTPDDEPHYLWVKALQELETAIYNYDCYENMTNEEKLNYCITNEEELKEYGRIRREIAELQKQNKAA